MVAPSELVEKEEAQGATLSQTAELGGSGCATASGECRDSRTRVLQLLSGTLLGGLTSLYPLLTAHIVDDMKHDYRLQDVCILTRFQIKSTEDSFIIMKYKPPSVAYHLEHDSRLQDFKMFAF